MVSVGEHGTVTSHHLVQPSGGRDGEALHGAPERTAVLGLDEHMDVVVLDREMGDARVEPSEDLEERLLNARVAAARSELPNVAPHAEGDVERVADVDRAGQMRNAGSGLARTPALGPAGLAGRSEAEVELVHISFLADIDLPSTRKHQPQKIPAHSGAPTAIGPTRVARPAAGSMPPSHRPRLEPPAAAAERPGPDRTPGPSLRCSSEDVDPSRGRCEEPRCAPRFTSSTTQEPLSPFSRFAFGARND